MKNEKEISLAFEGDHFKRIIATKIWIIPQGSTFENYLCLKKENLAYEIILLNVVDSLLHHVTHVETTKMHGTIFVQHSKKACWQKMVIT
jgi:hypothetical protein